MALELGKICSAEDMAGLAGRLGFLPFFKNRIPGFSVEECCPRELWFSESADGPWEWKGPAVRTGLCLYGKFFGGKAGFVSREWFPDFANLRRDGYDFDARFDDGLAALKDKSVYDAVARHGAVLSRELKDELNYRKGGAVGFDTVITRLQMQTYIVISDFVYMRDRHGQTYGWGVAKYATPEAQLGAELPRSAYSRDPVQSRERIIDHLRSVLPDAGEGGLRRLIG